MVLIEGWHVRVIFRCGSTEVERFDSRSDSVRLSEYTINGAIGPPGEPVQPIFDPTRAGDAAHREYGAGADRRHHVDAQRVRQLIGRLGGGQCSFCWPRGCSPGEVSCGSRWQVDNRGTLRPHLTVARPNGLRETFNLALR